MRNARLILPILLTGAFSSPALAQCWHNGAKWVCAPGCTITRSGFDAFRRQWIQYDCRQLHLFLIFAGAVAVVLVIRYLVDKYRAASSVEILPAAPAVPTAVPVYYTRTEYQDFQYEQFLYVLQRQTAIEHQLAAYLTERNKNQKLLADSTPAYTLNLNTLTPQAATQSASSLPDATQNVTIVPTPSDVDNLLKSLHEVTPETRETIVRLYGGLRKETSA